MHRAVDVHIHVVPQDFPAYHIHFNGKQFRTLSEDCWSIGRRLDQMDAMTIGFQVLSPMPELLSYRLPLSGCVATDPLRQQVDQRDGGPAA